VSVPGLRKVRLGSACLCGDAQSLPSGVGDAEGKSGDRDAVVGGYLCQPLQSVQGEHGHLFQGRYKALLVDEDSSLGPLCDYIHLNPVRAGVATVAGLRDVSHSSYWHLWRTEGRPAFLRVETALKEAGGLADTAPGRAAYAAYLEWQAAEGPAGKNEAYANLSQGWALGTEEFKADLVRDHQIAAAARALEPNGAAEVRSMRWQEALEVAVDRLPATARTAPDAARKSAAWKVAVATHLKSTTDVSNGWLASQLDMGTAAYVSKTRRVAAAQWRSGKEMVGGTPKGKR